MTEVTTQRLLLRPPDEADLPAIAGLLDDVAVSRMLARVPHPYRLDHAQGWFATINRQGAGGERVFAVTANGKAIGMIGFQRKRREPTLGYWLGRPYWGRGLMSEAVQAAVHWFFSESDEAALYSGAFRDNPASLRIQEKLGFEVIGSAPLDCMALGRARTEFKTRLDRETFAGLVAENSGARWSPPLTAEPKQAT
ncbi:MAG TPA: GNAT family N-acetyltransferase [Afifellaceae bacterium]|nr:GNAT family N-acetyltransferase [Afifellaceae bacterium]